MTVPFNEPYDSLGQPHDHLFRAIVGDRKRAQDLLHTHVGPRFPGLLAPVPPIPRAGNFVDENLRSSQVDQLFEVKLCNGDTAFVYVLLEHKSTSDPGIALQLARYKNRIWEAYVAGELPVDGPAYPTRGWVVCGRCPPSSRWCSITAGSPGPPRTRSRR